MLVRAVTMFAYLYTIKIMTKRKKWNQLYIYIYIYTPQTNARTINWRERNLMRSKNFSWGKLSYYLFSFKNLIEFNNSLNKHVLVLRYLVKTIAINLDKLQSRSLCQKLLFKVYNGNDCISHLKNQTSWN